MKRKEQRVAIGIAVSIRGRLIVETRMNIIDYPYIMILNLWELEKLGEMKKRRTRVNNTYDNLLKADQMLGGVGRSSRSTALSDEYWKRILVVRTVDLADFNTLSPQSNIHYGERREASGMEALIATHDLICNNETGNATRPTRGQTTTIIDLTFTTPNLRRLHS